MKWILLLAAGLAFTSHSEIYKCDVNGVTTFRALLIKSIADKPVPIMVRGVN
jgi:hypothetical protein